MWAEENLHVIGLKDTIEAFIGTLSIEVRIKKFKYAPDRSISSLISASPLHQIGLFFTSLKQIEGSASGAAIGIGYMPCTKEFYERRVSHSKLALFHTRCKFNNKDYYQAIITWYVLECYQFSSSISGILSRIASITSYKQKSFLNHHHQEHLILFILFSEPDDHGGDGQECSPKI
ncbi:cytochrome P450 711A1 [Trifolium repens]|nr:cytochrome P450 711A1 [Trifolium repens]